MIALVRVDNRLIHGQVVSTWIPHLKADRVVVVDEEAADSPLIRAAMSMAVPPHLEVDILRPSEVEWGELSQPDDRVLVLVRDVDQAESALRAGAPVRDLNLGNIHFREGRRPVSPSVFLSDEELETLDRIAASGVEVEARAVPSDHGVGLDVLRDRLRAGT